MITLMPINSWMLCKGIMLTPRSLWCPSTVGPAHNTHTYIFLIIDTLEYRLLYSNLTMYYKVFHNLTPWAPSDYFNIVIAPHNLHSVHHDFNIRKPLCRTNIFANDFFNRRVSACIIVCLVLSLIQSLLLRLNVLLYLLICPNFWSMLFSFASCAECYFTC